MVESVKLRCHFCEEQFPKKEDLLRHMRRHWLRRDEGEVRRSPEERRRRRRRGAVVTRVLEEQGSCEGSSEGSVSESDREEKHLDLRKPPSRSMEKHPDPRKPPSRSFLARTRQSLASSQLEVSGGQQLACLTCLKTFANLQNLKRHLRLHLARDSHVAEIHSDGEDEGQGDSKMDCDFCPEKFTNKAAFSVHMLTHNTQELVCYVCKKSYSDRYSLRYHLRTHGIGRQIRCELCGTHGLHTQRHKALPLLSV